MDGSYISTKWSGCNPKSVRTFILGQPRGLHAGELGLFIRGRLTLAPDWDEKYERLHQKRNWFGHRLLSITVAFHRRAIETRIF